MKPFRRCAAPHPRWLLLSLGMVACGAPHRDAAPAASASAAAPAPAAVAASPTDAVSATPDAGTAAQPAAQASAVPETPEPIDVRTPDGVLLFVTRLCERASVDAAWVEAHVQLPLLGNALVNENGGDPLLGGRLEEDAGSVAQLDLCKAPPDRAAVRAVTAGQGQVTATIALRGFDHRLTFAVAEPEPRLIELSLILPEPPVPRSPTKVRPYEIDGRVLDATGAQGPAVERAVRRDLAAHPACLRAYLARSTDSATLLVAVSKPEGQPATARVYASTVAPASLLACLEQELTGKMAATFRRTPFEARYLLMLLVPTSGDAGDDEILGRDPDH